MAFCSNCGTEVAAGAGFCPKCGQAQASAPAAGTAATAPAAQTGMTENVAGLLCYVLGWVTGLIFFLIDKRPFVRFHAAQSIVVFGGLHVISIVLGVFFGAGFMFHGGFGVFGIWTAIYGLVELVGVILWVLLMVKSYQHETFEVPVAAGIAKGFAGK